MANRIYKHILTAACLLLIIGLFSGCYTSEELNVPQQEYDDSNLTELDNTIDQNFTQKYGMAIRYRYSDSYLSVGQRVTPVNVDNVEPMLDFIDKYWISPYLNVENGEEFFKNHVPAEIVLLGGLIYVGNNILLGVADAGARVTLLNVNAIDPNDPDWVLFQLGTIYHEFAHVVHQRYKLPNSYETISATGYTGPGSWYTLTDNEALERGFVSPYATSSPNEDFAELVAFYLYDPDFTENFLTDESDCDSSDCLERNEGRELIRQKLASVRDHYSNVTGIDLDKLREATQFEIANP